MPGPNPKHNINHGKKPKKRDGFLFQNSVFSPISLNPNENQEKHKIRKDSSIANDPSEKNFLEKDNLNGDLDLNDIPEGQPGSELFQSELTFQFEGVLSSQKKNIKRDLHHQLAMDLARKVNDELAQNEQKKSRTFKSVKIQPTWIQQIAPNTPKVALDDIVNDLQDSCNCMIESCKGCPVNCLQQLTNSEPSPKKIVDAQSIAQDLRQSLQNLLIDALESKMLRNNSFHKSLTQPKPELKIDHPSKSIFQFKIMLRNYRPLVWRRIEIGCDATFEELHDAIQEAFGWSGMHLHDFSFNNPHFFNKIQRIDGIPPTRGTEFDDGYEMEGDYEEDQVHLHEIFALGVTRVVYTYDFGDNWEHQIILEGVLPRDKIEYYPRVVKSKGDSPEEDSRCY